MIPASHELLNRKYGQASERPISVSALLRNSMKKRKNTQAVSSWQEGLNRQQPTISCVMIVRNEEECLERRLKNVCNVVDEILWILVPRMEPLRSQNASAPVSFNIPGKTISASTAISLPPMHRATGFFKSTPMRSFSPKTAPNSRRWFDIAVPTTTTSTSVPNFLYSSFFDPASQRDISISGILIKMRNYISICGRSSGSNSIWMKESVTIEDKTRMRGAIMKARGRNIVHMFMSVKFVSFCLIAFWVASYDGLDRDYSSLQS